MLEHFQAISTYEYEVNPFVDTQPYKTRKQFYLMVVHHSKESFLETDLFDSQNVWRMWQDHFELIYIFPANQDFLIHYQHIRFCQQVAQVFLIGESIVF